MPSRRAAFGQAFTRVAACDRKPQSNESSEFCKPDWSRMSQIQLFSSRRPQPRQNRRESMRQPCAAKQRCGSVIVGVIVYAQAHGSRPYGCTKCLIIASGQQLTRQAFQWLSFCTSSGLTAPPACLANRCYPNHHRKPMAWI